MYVANPALYRASLYFDAMKSAMQESRVYITSEDIPNLQLWTWTSRT